MDVDGSSVVITIIMHRVEEPTFSVSLSSYITLSDGILLSSERVEDVGKRLFSTLEILGNFICFVTHQLFFFNTDAVVKKEVNVFLFQFYQNGFNHVIEILLFFC